MGILLAISSEVAANEKATFQPNRLIICKRDPSEFKSQELFNRAKIKHISNLGNSNCELVSTPNSIRAAQEILFFDRNLIVSPDYILSAAKTSNDTLFSELWGLKNNGSNSGITGVDIGAVPAWEISTGTKDNVVGIIDTGCQYTHPDLENNIWTNPGEIPGNGIDDDHNGYIDDVHGINAIKGTGDPNDDNGHGTHVAGIIGAVGNNTLGISGVNWNTSLLCCKFLDENGLGNTSDAIICLDYIRNLKTRTSNRVNISVTNNSWGGGDFSGPLRSAILEQKNANILFVVAAGNSHDNNDEIANYPASFDSSNILSVGAFNNIGNFSVFSNFGQRSVAIVAPGENILSTITGDKYEFLSGTSMAAPHVTGVAALLKAQDNKLNYGELRNLIIAGGMPDDAFEKKTISGRRLLAAGSDGLGAMTCSNQQIQTRLKPKDDKIFVSPGSIVSLSMININCQYPAIATPVIVQKQGKILDTVNLLDSDVSNASLNDGIFEGDWIAPLAGKYTLIFPGNDSVLAEVYLAGQYYFNKKPYHYIEIAGDNIQLVDESRFSLEAPFPIRFAHLQNSFNTINISDNGVISLTQDRKLDFNNLNLPAPLYSTIIAPFWDDFKPEGESNIYYAVIGKAPLRKLVIEWRKVRHYSSGTGDGVTFEVVFTENDPTIQFNYKDVIFGNSSIDKGNSATIGIQSSQNLATVFSFKHPLISNQMSLAVTLDEPANSTKFKR